MRRSKLFNPSSSLRSLQCSPLGARRPGAGGIRHRLSASAHDDAGDHPVRADLRREAGPRICRLLRGAREAGQPLGRRGARGRRHPAFGRLRIRPDQGQRRARRRSPARRGTARRLTFSPCSFPAGAAGRCPLRPIRRSWPAFPAGPDGDAQRAQLNQFYNPPQRSTSPAAAPLRTPRSPRSTNRKRTPRCPASAGPSRSITRCGCRSGTSSPTRSASFSWAWIRRT